eukprot:gene1336-777_t
MSSLRHSHTEDGGAPHLQYSSPPCQAGSQPSFLEKGDRFIRCCCFVHNATFDTSSSALSCSSAAPRRLLLRIKAELKREGKELCRITQGRKILFSDSGLRVALSQHGPDNVLEYSTQCLGGKRTEVHSLLDADIHLSLLHCCCYFLCRSVLLADLSTIREGSAIALLSYLNSLAASNSFPYSHLLDYTAITCCCCSPIQDLDFCFTVIPSPHYTRLYTALLRSSSTKEQRTNNSPTAVALIMSLRINASATTSAGQALLFVRDDPVDGGHPARPPPPPPLSPTVRAICPFDVHERFLSRLLLSWNPPAPSTAAAPQQNKNCSSSSSVAAEATTGFALPPLTVIPINSAYVLLSESPAPINGSAARRVEGNRGGLRLQRIADSSGHAPALGLSGHLLRELVALLPSASLLLSPPPRPPPIAALQGGAGGGEGEREREVSSGASCHSTLTQRPRQLGVRVAAWEHVAAAPPVPTEEELATATAAAEAAEAALLAAQQQVTHRFLVCDAEVTHSVWAITVQLPHANRRAGVALWSRGERPISVDTDPDPPSSDPPLPTIGAGVAGYADGYFSECRLHSPIALCWRGRDPTETAELNRTAAAPAAPAVVLPRRGTEEEEEEEEVAVRFSCSGAFTQLFISDAGNHCIRLADFTTGYVRTVVGLQRIAGYRDGNVTAALLAAATGMVYTSRGLVFTDGPNGAVRLLAGPLPDRLEPPAQQTGHNAAGPTGTSDPSQKNASNANEEEETEESVDDLLSEIDATLRGERRHLSSLAASSRTSMASRRSRRHRRGRGAPSTTGDGTPAQSSTALASLSALLQDTESKDPPAVAAAVPATPSAPPRPAEQVDSFLLDSRLRVWTVAGGGDGSRTSTSGGAASLVSLSPEKNRQAQWREGAPEGAPPPITYRDAPHQPHCARFGYLSGIAVVPDGSGGGEEALYLCDATSSAIRVLSKDGVHTVVGPMDFPRTEEQEEGQHGPSPLGAPLQLVPLSLTRRRTTRARYHPFSTADLDRPSTAAPGGDASGAAATPSFSTLYSTYMAMLVVSQTHAGAVSVRLFLPVPEYFVGRLDREPSAVSKVLLLGSEPTGGSGHRVLGELNTPSVEVQEEDAAVRPQEQKRKREGSGRPCRYHSLDQRRHLRYWFPWLLPPYPALPSLHHTLHTAYMHVGGREQRLPSPTPPPAAAAASPPRSLVSGTPERQPSIRAVLDAAPPTRRHPPLLGTGRCVADRLHIWAGNLRRGDDPSEGEPSALAPPAGCGGPPRDTAAAGSMPQLSEMEDEEEEEGGGGRVPRVGLHQPSFPREDSPWYPGPPPLRSNTVSPEAGHGAGREPSLDMPYAMGLGTAAGEAPAPERSGDQHQHQHNDTAPSHTAAAATEGEADVEHSQEVSAIAMEAHHRLLATLPAARVEGQGEGGVRAAHLSGHRPAMDAEREREERDLETIMSALETPQKTKETLLRRCQPPPADLVVSASLHMLDDDDDDGTVSRKEAGRGGGSSSTPSPVARHSLQPYTEDGSSYLFLSQPSSITGEELSLSPPLGRANAAQEQQLRVKEEASGSQAMNTGEEDMGAAKTYPHELAVQLCVPVSFSSPAGAVPSASSPSSPPSLQAIAPGGQALLSYPKQWPAVHKRPAAYGQPSRLPPSPVQQAAAIPIASPVEVHDAPISRLFHVYQCFASFTASGLDVPAPPPCAYPPSHHPHRRRGCPPQAYGMSMVSLWFYLHLTQYLEAPTAFSECVEELAEQGPAPRRRETRQQQYGGHAGDGAGGRVRLDPRLAVHDLYRRGVQQRGYHVYEALRFESFVYLLTLLGLWEEKALVRLGERLGEGSQRPHGTTPTAPAGERQEGLLCLEHLFAGPIGAFGDGGTEQLVVDSPARTASKVRLTTLGTTQRSSPTTPLQRRRRRQDLFALFAPDQLDKTAEEREEEERMAHSPILPGVPSRDLFGKLRSAPANNGDGSALSVSCQRCGRGVGKEVLTRWRRYLSCQRAGTSSTTGGGGAVGVLCAEVLEEEGGFLAQQRLVLDRLVEALVQQHHTKTKEKEDSELERAPEEEAEAERDDEQPDPLWEQLLLPDAAVGLRSRDHTAAALSFVCTAREAIQRAEECLPAAWVPRPSSQHHSAPRQAKGEPVGGSTPPTRAAPPPPIPAPPPTTSAPSEGKPKRKRSATERAVNDIFQRLIFHERGLWCFFDAFSSPPATAAAAGPAGAAAGCGVLGRLSENILYCGRKPEAEHGGTAVPGWRTERSSVSFSSTAKVMAWSQFRALWQAVGLYPAFVGHRELLLLFKEAVHLCLLVPRRRQHHQRQRNDAHERWRRGGRSRVPPSAFPLPEAAGPQGEKEEEEGEGGGVDFPGGPRPTPDEVLHFIPFVEAVVRLALHVFHDTLPEAEEEEEGGGAAHTTRATAAGRSGRPPVSAAEKFDQLCRLLNRLLRRIAASGRPHHSAPTPRQRRAVVLHARGGKLSTEDRLLYLLQRWKGFHVGT